MPLFDMFRKSSKQGPVKSPQNGSGKTPSADASFMSPEMQKKRYDAAMEFIQAFQERIPLVGGKPHAGTVLSIAACLAGTSLFRAINQKDFTPGVIVLSEEVNQAYPQLLNLFSFYCKENGIGVMAKPLVTQFPEKDKPRMDVDRILAEYQDQYHTIMKKHGLDYLESARAGIVVCSIVFQYHCTKVKDIDPYVGTGIIAMGVVQGAKTAPPALGTGKPSPAGTAIKSTASRLVLGERDAAIQEALDTGGEFIDINPGILQILKDKNIDPYLFYEQALKKQVEEKIPRIDFVKANVDELFNAWKSKPLANAPEYVRAIFWLKNNARTYGYEQSGNSWILRR